MPGSQPPTQRPPCRCTCLASHAAPRERVLGLSSSAAARRSNRKGCTELGAQDGSSEWGKGLQPRWLRRESRAVATVGRARLTTPSVRGGWQMLLALCLPRHVAAFRPLSLAPRLAGQRLISGKPRGHAERRGRWGQGWCEARGPRVVLSVTAPCVCAPDPGHKTRRVSFAAAVGACAAQCGSAKIERAAYDDGSSAGRNHW